MRTLATLLASACLLLAASPADAAISVNKRAFGQGKYALDLDNVRAGWISDVDGGHAVADVVEERLAHDYYVKKHIGNVKYEEISFSCGTGMSRAFYEWIAASMAGKTERKSGSIVYLDREGNEVLRTEFSFAILTELGMPALDAASKDAAKMTIKIRPEVTRTVIGSGRRYAIDAKKQKQWLPSNFRMSVTGLDESMTRVSKVDAFTWKARLADPASGDPGGSTLSNVALSLPLDEIIDSPIASWAESFILKGDNGDDQEKTGALEFLDEDGVVLFQLTFRNLGIFKVAPDKMEAGAEGVRRIKAEMYCEDVRFAYSAAATFN